MMRSCYKTYEDHPEEQSQAGEQIRGDEQIQEEERSQLKRNRLVNDPVHFDYSWGELTRSTRGTPASSKSRGRGSGESKATGRRGWGTDTGCWASESGCWASESDGQTTTSGFADARAGGERGGTSTTKPSRGVGRGRAVHRARNDLGSTNDCQTESSLLFRVDQRGICGTGGLGFPRDATELFCVCENKVHVLYKEVFS